MTGSLLPARQLISLRLGKSGSTAIKVAQASKEPGPRSARLGNLRVATSPLQRDRATIRPICRTPLVGSPAEHIATHVSRRQGGQAMSVVVTKPSRLSNSAIREYAERIGSHYDAYDRAGTADLHDLLRKLGGRLEIGDSRESLKVNKAGDFVIYLPRVTSSRRDRFTIAHELGHYFLHYLHPKREGPARFGRGERNNIETQANVFASSLLMPEAEFRAAWGRHAGNLLSLARQFEVSPAAVEVRAQVLNLA